MSGRNNRIVRNREKNKNGFSIKIIVSVFFVFMLLFGIFVLMKKQTKNPEKLGQTFENYVDISYEYFMLSSKENIGVIDKKANLLVEPKYAKVDIPNPEKDVFFCYTEEGKSTILNKKGDEILTQFEKVEVIQSTNENREIEKNVLKYQKNDLYGLIDLEGNVITDAIYQEITSLNDRPGRILVKSEEKYGILAVNGEVVIDTKYDAIKADGYSSGKDFYTKTGYIVSQKTENEVNFGYIDYKGNLILDVKYEALERALTYEENDIYLIAMQKGKNGVFKNKKKIIDLNFQSILYSTIFVVNKNGKYGFYGKDGNVILEPKYTDFSIAGNYISVTENGDTKLYDINGNLINTNRYTKMTATENPEYFIAEDEEGYFSIIGKDVSTNEKYAQIQYAFDHYFIFTDENGKTGLVNALTKEVVIEPQYDFMIRIEGTKVLEGIDGMQNVIDIYAKDLTKTITMEGGVVESLENGYGMCYSQTQMKYFDEDGNVVENTKVYPNQKLYAVCQNDKWGFCDEAGKNIVECQYDIVTELNEYGFAGIKKGGKWGVVNENGEIVVEPSYELETYYFPQFIGKYQFIQSEITYCEEV